MYYRNALAREDQQKLLERQDQEVHLILVSIYRNFEVLYYFQKFEGNTGI